MLVTVADQATVDAPHAPRSAEHACTGAKLSVDATVALALTLDSRL